MKKTLVRYFLFIFLLFLGNSGRIFAQQGFGTKEPSKASVVDMQSENRGLLIPRVELVNLITFLPNTGEEPADATSASKTNSLLVYNTATAGVAPYIVTPGYYYWTSANQRWNRLVVSQDLSTTTTANNGLTKTDNNIQLGGQLEDDTVIDLNGNTLAIEGLPAGSSTDSMVVADPTTGVLKKKRAPTMLFYMPPVIFDTTSTGNNLTRDLHQDYVDLFEGNTLYMARGAGAPSMQYTGGLIKSSGAPDIPIYEADELWFYIVYYDTTVFAGPSGTGKPTIDANGVLSYSIIGTATEASYMTIAFSVRD